MKVLKPIRFSPFFTALLALAVLSVPRTVQAQQNWKATVGGQSKDMGRQAVAFLPNELWIHAGDGITLTFASGDIPQGQFLTGRQADPFDITQHCRPHT